jgi:hypothetical protein
MQWPWVSHAESRQSAGDALDRPQAKSIAAKLTEAGGALERARARLDTPPELVDKLEHLEGEDDSRLRLLSWVDRHAEVA